MPVYPLRFTRWEGVREGIGLAWWHLFRSALRARKGSRLVRYLRIVWGLYFAVFLFATYVGARWGETSQRLGVDAPDELRMVLTDASTRLFVFLSSPLEVLLLVIVAVYAGAGLIADDRRTGALALYLSKPVSRSQYVAGRVCVVGWYVGCFSVLPALGLLLFGVLIAEEPGKAVPDLLLVPPLLACWAALTVVFGVSVLLLSSLAENGRTAGVIFVVYYFLAGFPAGILDLVFGFGTGALVDVRRLAPSAMRGLLRPKTMSVLDVVLGPSWLALSAIAVFGAAGLAFLWYRTRPGGENR